MTKWKIYYTGDDGYVKLDEFIGTQLELAEQLKKYKYIMEVTRVYD